MAKRSNRVAWGLVGLISLVLAVAACEFFAELRPYWIAKYHGQEADLRGARLISAPLRAADLSDARLEEANLAGADLVIANLHSARLTGANLSNANLYHADLQEATLVSADLTGATLIWADLTDADLTNANLRGVRYNPFTRWPDGFDPTRQGAILVK